MYVIVYTLIYILRIQIAVEFHYRPQELTHASISSFILQSNMPIFMPPPLPVWDGFEQHRPYHLHQGWRAEGGGGRHGHACQRASARILHGFCLAIHCESLSLRRLLWQPRGYILWQFKFQIQTTAPKLYMHCQSWTYIVSTFVRFRWSTASLRSYLQEIYNLSPCITHIYEPITQLCGQCVHNKMTKKNGWLPWIALILKMRTVLLYWCQSCQ